MINASFTNSWRGFFLSIICNLLKRELQFVAVYSIPKAGGILNL